MSSSSLTAGGAVEALWALLGDFAAVETGRVRFTAGVVLRFGESDSFVRMAFSRSSFDRGR
jgi:hypothetical protein